MKLHLRIKAISYGWKGLNPGNALECNYAISPSKHSRRKISSIAQYHLNAENISINFTSNVCSIRGKFRLVIVQQERDKVLWLVIDTHTRSSL